MIDSRIFSTKTIDALLDQGWMSFDQLVDQNFCQKLIEVASRKEDQKDFFKAGIGRAMDYKIDPRIRIADISWIENWNQSKELETYQSFLSEFMIYLNNNFFLSCKRFESQFAYYPNGGYYKKHIDQLKENRHRQISTILYLNTPRQGGELVIYNRDNSAKMDKTIKPVRGQFVCFFSAHIFHQVLECKSDRYSLTSWLRDDEIIPLI